MNGAHEELLRRLALGELASDAPEVVAAAEADAEFARSVAELDAVVAGLDRAGELDAVLADAALRRGEPGEDAVEQFVRARVAEAGGGRGARGFRRNAWLAVLAAAIAMLVWSPWRELTPYDPNQTLGDGEGVLALAPEGQVQEFGLFEWTGPSEGGLFRVRVFDGDKPLRGGDSGEIDALTWQSDPALVATWPDHIRWTVEWTERFTDANRLDEAEAWRFE